MNRSVKHSTCQSIHTINPSTDPPNNQSINKTMNQSIDQSISQNGSISPHIHLWQENNSRVFGLTGSRLAGMSYVLNQESQIFDRTHNIVCVKLYLLFRVLSVQLFRYLPHTSAVKRDEHQLDGNMHYRNAHIADDDRLMTMTMMLTMPMKISSSAAAAAAAATPLYSPSSSSSSSSFSKPVEKVKHSFGHTLW